MTKKHVRVAHNAPMHDNVNDSVSNSSFSSYSLTTLATTSIVLEGLHLANSIPVKERWESWQFHSMLDSYVIHTIMLLVMARYFRCWKWHEAIFFAVSRIVAEGYLPVEYGGMMSIKERAGDLDDIGFAIPGAYYFAFLAATMVVLIREKVMHPLFLGLGAWGYMFTILPAGTYFADDVSWGYWMAHAANVITFNPYLVALLMGYDGPAPAPPSASKATSTRILSEHEPSKVH